MKLLYNEEGLKSAIREQIFSYAPQTVTAFPLERLMMAQLIKQDGERLLKGCVLEVKDDAILVVWMDSFRADKTQGFTLFHFSEIQGIEMKSGKLNDRVTLQFKDGRKYVFQIRKKSSKYLPNQAENLAHSLAIMESKNLHDMKNKHYKKNRIKHIITLLFYIPTLIIFGLIALSLWDSFASDRLPLMYIFVIGAGIIHFILFMAATFLIEHLWDRRFKKEYQLILREYERTQNARLFLEELSNIRHKPKTDFNKAAYYFSMSTALHKNGRTEEALDHLDKIRTTEQVMREMVNQQRLVLERELENKENHMAQKSEI